MTVRKRKRSSAAVSFPFPKVTLGKDFRLNVTHPVSKKTVRGVTEMIYRASGYDRVQLTLIVQDKHTLREYAWLAGCVALVREDIWA